MRHQSFPHFLRHDSIVCSPAYLWISDHERSIVLLFEPTAKSADIKMGEGKIVRHFAYFDSFPDISFKNHLSMHSGSVIYSSDSAFHAIVHTPDCCLDNMCRCIPKKTYDG